MPVDGLPRTLETILNTLLQDNTLSSFKIQGKGKQTCVVLRLSPPAHPKDAEQGQSSSHSDTAVYRRKCPSQVARDRRRAEQHRNSVKHNTTAPASPSGLFLPTPPSLYYAKDTESAADVFNFNATSSREPAVVHSKTDRQLQCVNED